MDRYRWTTRGGRHVPPTSSVSPNGVPGPKDPHDPLPPVGPQRRHEPIGDNVANVLGRVTIVAVIGWVLAAAEFLALIVCTRGCAH